MLREEWEVLQHGLIPLDPARPTWDIVAERSGSWFRATIDGRKAIEYYDPLPPSGPGHRTFGLSSMSCGFTITRLAAWRRRPPETVSVLEIGRFLLRRQKFAEAAEFFGDLVSAPRGTPVDDEARLLHGLALEGMGDLDGASAAYRAAGEREDSPFAAMAHLWLARLSIARGDLEQAGREVQRARQLAPAFPSADILRRALVDLMRKPVEVRPSTDREALAVLADILERKMIGPMGGVKSLEPLRHLPLTVLICSGSQATDLGPLKDMPLTWLAIDNSHSLSDLSPLRGLRLTRLNCGFCRVTDLSPLQGMPLREFGCTSNPVIDLAPLEGMPLVALDCRSTGVSDLAPLACTPLKAFACDCSEVRDLGPLRGVPLERLDCYGTKVNDLGPLAGLPLSHLGFHATAVKDLGPLKGMPLRYLDCRFTGVSDLGPLKGMPLKALLCAGTGVPDLAPLRGMPMEQLGLDHSPVRDLAILRDLPLRKLHIEGCDGITDLTPLAEMNLDAFTFTPSHIKKGLEGIRAMKSLTGLGVEQTLFSPFMSPEEFWRRYDAGEFR